MLRLFLETDCAPVRTELHHAVALGIAHLITENAGAVFDRERLAIEIEFPVENVVAQDERRAGVAEEIRADQERLGNSFRLWLRGVLDPNSEPRAVAEIILQHRQILRRGNDQHIPQPAQHQRGERITNHRLVVNRQQLFADDLGERIEAGAGAAGEENCFFVHVKRTITVAALQ